MVTRVFSCVSIAQICGPLNGPANQDRGKDALPFQLSEIRDPGLH